MSLNNEPRDRELTPAEQERILGNSEVKAWEEQEKQAFIERNAYKFQPPKQRE